MRINLYFAPHLTSVQRTAAIEAANEYNRYIKDDFDLNIYLTGSDQFTTDIAAGAFPNTVGGIDYDDPKLGKNLREGNFIHFEEYYNALVNDQQSGRDSTALNTLSGDLISHNKFGSTVRYRDPFNKTNIVRGLEVTSANAKAVGINYDYGSSDGVIALNSLDRYGATDIENSIISEYRQISSSEGSYQGNLAFINNSGQDYEDREFRGTFVLRGSQIDTNPDGSLAVEGDLKIFRVVEYTDRTIYKFKTKDDSFGNGEKNQITFTATGIDSGVHAASVFNVDSTGDTETQKPYSSHNPYVQSEESIEDLIKHEIGHILGLTSSVDKIPEEYGSFVTADGTEALDSEQADFRLSSSFAITPFDLYRNSELDNGTVVRSLNPNVNTSGSFYSINEGIDRVKLAEGKHVSADYLLDIYGADGGAASNPYLEHLADNDVYQASHLRHEDSGLFSPVHSYTDSGRDFSTTDLSILDVLGYDINYDGLSQNGKVRVFDTWDEVAINDVADALYARRGSRTRSRGRIGYSSETGSEGEFILGNENLDLANSIINSFDTDI